MSVVLVTGSSSGIGLETALAFARRGDMTYASMRSPEGAPALAGRARAEGLTLDVLALDVTDEASVTSAVRGIEDRHGAVDILVNNAGIDHSGSVETLPIERARAIVETNLWGPVRTSRAALPAMRARGAGVIVNVSSLAGRVPGTPYGGFYAASKHALAALSESLAAELGPFGVRVVCVEPGFVATEIFSKSWSHGTRAFDPYSADHRWVREFFVDRGERGGGDPRLVADAIVAAAHDRATPVHLLVGDDAATYVDVAARAGGYEGWATAVIDLFESVAGPRPSPAKGSSTRRHAA
jgi:NAD(P)-dependent dehydrogenase (short-subunit alcohol dehydrogenase family)